MRELSLHLLDLIENAIRAGASIISVTITEKPEADLLEIRVEDNGRGLTVSPDEALDPFYTTKEGKRTGLGLSLFRAAAEQANGTLTVGRSTLGGVAIAAKMQLSHIDRKPLGDIPATLSSVVCTNPHVDFWCQLCHGQAQYEVRVSDVVKEFGANERCGLAIARRVSEKLKSGLAAMSA